MGVDYYSCDHCDEIYDDCGHYYTYCENCGKHICFYCQVELGMRDIPEHFSDGAESLGNYWDGRHLVKCPYCSGEVFSDEQLLSYLLKKVDMTKEDLIKEIKEKI